MLWLTLILWHGAHDAYDVHPEPVLIVDLCTAQVLMSPGAQQLLAEAEADDPAKWHGFMPGDGDGDTMDVDAFKGAPPAFFAVSYITQMLVNVCGV